MMSKKNQIALQEALNRITKEEFEEYYKIHTKPDTWEHFNMSVPVFDAFIKFHNIIKTKDDINATRVQTTLQLYGVENVSQSDEVKTNTIRNVTSKYGSHEAFISYQKTRQRESIIERYGSTSGHFWAGNEKRKNTCLERYGVESYFSSDVAIDKIRRTKLEKYGDSGYHNMEKMKETMLKRYGVEYNIASDNPEINGRGTYHKKLKEDPEFKQSVIAKRVNTCKTLYGEDYYIQQVRKALKAVSSHGNSNVNKYFAAYLLSCGIPFEKEVAVGNFVYDFALGKSLIELDPYATHNCSWGIFGDPKDKEYHRNKTLNAIKNGYQCYHIFDWCDYRTLIYSIINKKCHKIDTGLPKMFIFDTKTKELVSEENNDTVVIYDDGFEVTIDE